MIVKVNGRVSDPKFSPFQWSVFSGYLQINSRKEASLVTIRTFLSLERNSQSDVLILMIGAVDADIKHSSEES